tara:strand:+ start:255 stop:719 length:465 start_codon:yes stop_codon:yes gene_type:complete
MRNIIILSLLVVTGCTSHQTVLDRHEQIWQQERNVAQSRAKEFAQHIWYVHDIDVIEGTDGAGKKFYSISVLLSDGNMPRHFFRIDEHHERVHAWLALKEFEVIGDSFLQRGYTFEFSHKTHNIHKEHRVESYLSPVATRTFTILDERKVVGWQ